MSLSEQKAVGVLALNPAVDVSYEIPQLLADRKVRAGKSWFHPGGNGINVSRGLAELGVDVHCCSVTGGESGDLLLRLLGDTLEPNHNHFRVQGETRLNATLLQQNPPSQYEVDSTGPEIPADVLEDVTACLLNSCREGIAVLTGSTPPGVPQDIYRRLAEEVKSQGGRAVVDAHGPVLLEALKAQPYLLRLNQYVLEMATNRRLENTAAIARTAREIQNGGVTLICISLGQKGAVLVDEANSYHCTAPRVHVQSTVGCGDSLVAGLVAAALSGYRPESMLQHGILCGSATASHPGTELFSRAEVEDSSHELELTALDI